ncbi:MAG: hypothetical protein HY074_12365 [Deltaproteobacteria bacterium]|nr:hypothetical protein [Deltaproteobacteria bacterium]
MRYAIRSVGIKAILMLSIVAPTTYAAVQTTSNYKADEVIVKYKDGVRRDRLAMEGIYDTASVVQVKRFHGGMRQFEQLVLEKGSDVKSVVANLEKNPAVEYAQPNYILKALPIEMASAKPTSTPVLITTTKT